VTIKSLQQALTSRDASSSPGEFNGRGDRGCRGGRGAGGGRGRGRGCDRVLKTLTLISLRLALEKI
jgi:hypothetical protein